MGKGVGRDLQGMGLITQVQKGDTVPTVVGVNGNSPSKTYKQKS